ncbi:MAG: guanylate kinase [Thermoguttaceae bacterium]|nr:guanylate kinase [Thermoguttaceae bacterium]
MATTESTSRRGRVLVVSGPSGVGKGTLLKRLFDSAEFPLRTSVSATTRAPRVGEENGVHYWFMTREEFVARRDRGEFLESFEVYEGGALYGTLRKTVEESVRLGDWVVLEIDVKGARSVVAQIPDAVTIFIAPPSLDALRERLTARGTETREELEKRMAQASSEIAQSDFYRYRIINDDLDVAYEELVAVMREIARS